MKRTSLTTAVIAGLVGAAGLASNANAVFLNTDGLGEVLVYPYYTVNGGNSTLLSVVNTHNEGKAVKVRFLEAYDSREVLDFNLYLSPFDVWVAQVVPSGAGGGAIFTNDNSCTEPSLPTTAATAQPFLTYAFDGGLTTVPAPTDGGPTDVSRTLEGYVELIEMGVVNNLQQGTLKAITHVNGVPKSCDQIHSAWSGAGYWGAAGADTNVDISGPTGGLFGSGTIINVNQGEIEAYNADAIDQFYAIGTGGQQTAPNDLAPSISSGTSLVSYVFANGQLATTSYTLAIDAVSSLFTATSIMNEYVVASSIGASTEWVITFPTKRFYVDPNYTLGPVPFRPFDKVFGLTDATSCVPVTIGYFNREEGSTTTGSNFSPSPVHGNSLCYEAQVITFGQGQKPSKILGSNLVANIATIYPTGWAQIGFTNTTQHAVTPDRAAPVAGENTFYGLPVTGFSVTNYVNGTLTDTSGNKVLSNYTALYRHKFNRLCTSSGTSATLTACS